MLRNIIFQIKVIRQSSIVGVKTLNFFQVSLFIFSVKLRDHLVLLSHLLRHLGQQMEDKMIQRFLRTMSNKFLVSRCQCFSELGVLCLIHIIITYYELSINIRYNSMCINQCQFIQNCQIVSIIMQNI